MLASLSEFKFYQSFRVPVEEVDDIRFLVEVDQEDGGTSYVDDARLIDISLTGLGFSTTERLSVGEIITMSLQYKRHHLDINGKVVRSFSSNLKENELIYGIELEADHELKKFLEHLINGFSQERLRESLIQSALSERYTSSSEGFEMFSLLLSLFNDMSKFGEKQDFIVNMLEEVCRVLSASRASLFLINPDTNELEAVAALGVDNKDLKFDYRLGVAGSVFTTGVALNIDTINDKSRFDERVDKQTGFTTKSIICHPIHNREDKVIGVIEILNKRNEDRFTVEDEKAMKVVSLVFSSLYHNYNPVSQSSQIRAFSTPFDREYAFIGKSELVRGLRSGIRKLKDVDSPLLIEGEAGAGKTLLAKIIHYEGSRGLKAFEVFNCSGYDTEQLENDLFGHGPEMGILEQCNGGTVVLKNVSHLPYSVQRRLFKVLSGTEKVGNNTELNIRVISTTRENLPPLVESGMFHDQLYDFISKGHLEIGPLRKRKEDIVELVNYFFKVECKKQGFLLKSFSPAAMEKILEYDWPGNVTEVKKCIERVVLYHPKTHIISNLKNGVIAFFDKEKSSQLFDQIPFASDYTYSLKDRLALIERQMIIAEIKRNDGNKSKAAKEMGISREALRKKLIFSEAVLKEIEAKMQAKKAEEEKAEKQDKEAA